MTTTQTRRAILAGAAAIPALSLPAIAAERDPIFAAIERHRKAEAAYREFGRSFADKTGPEVEALEKQFAELGEVSNRLITELVAMTPATVGGCAALLRHLDEYATAYECQMFADWNFAAPASTLLARTAAVLDAKA